MNFTTGNFKKEIIGRTKKFGAIAHNVNLAAPKFIVSAFLRDKERERER